MDECNTSGSVKRLHSSLYWETLQAGAVDRALGAMTCGGEPDAALLEMARGLLHDEVVKILISADWMHPGRLRALMCFDEDELEEWWRSLFEGRSISVYLWTEHSDAVYELFSFATLRPITQK